LRKIKWPLFKNQDLNSASKKEIQGKPCLASDQKPKQPKKEIVYIRKTSPSPLIEESPPGKHLARAERKSKIYPPKFLPMGASAPYF